MNTAFRNSSRSRTLTLIVIGCMIVFVARLFYLQVLRHEYYVDLATAEQVKSFTIPAKRGLIYGLDGADPVPLVLNRAVYTVFVDPRDVNDESAILTALNEIAGGNVRSSAAELMKKKDTRYQVVATKLTRVQADALKEKNFKGVGFQEETERVYPEGTLAAQILGFVNNEGKGNYGVEGGLDDRLQGVDGKLRTVTDVRYVPLTIGDKNVSQPTKDGESIVLTIDRNVQAHTEEALQRGIEKAGATHGSAIVMDPQTGKVLAMANYPSYDPANFSQVTDGSVFNNNVISAPYEPASVIKTFAMATGVDQGVITPQSTYTNTDSIKVYDRTIYNAFRGLTGTRTMQDVLDNSLNTGTVTIAQRLGDGTNITDGARRTLYTYYHDRFGLGEPTNIELANESIGTVVSPDNQEGNAVRYANMTFGQGLNVTMLQVSAGFSSLVNGGKYFQPTVIDGVLQSDGTIKKTAHPMLRTTVSAETSATMTSMIHASRQSVAYMRNADTPGYTIGGKTGTAETLKNGVYVKSETVGTYLGYGGTDSPQYVIMVQVSAPGKNLEGGIHASPIFTDISNWMIEYLRLPPKG